MFTEERWAAAFTGVAGNDAEGAYAVLKALIDPVRRIPGAVSGFGVSRRLEEILRRATGGAADRETEIAIRFLTLLVRKGGLGHSGAVLQAIEDALNRRKGVVAAVVESAHPLDETYQAALKERIKARTGAAEVKLQTRMVPELLGGCRLCFGGQRFDASLRGQLERMAAGLGEDLRSRRVNARSSMATHGGL